MKSKKVLILGGSHRDIPLIKAAQALGYFVITLGSKAYYKGHAYANKYFLVNFNNLEKVRKVIKDEKINYLIPGSGEESYLNTVLLAKEFNIGNFDKIEVARLIHNKWKFKDFCLQHGISTPKGIYYQNNQDLSVLTFPVVIKPTSLSGGRGVDIVYNENELRKSLKKTTEITNEIFLEEYIHGQLIAYSIFLQDQKIKYAFSGVDETYLNPYLITTAYPLTLDNEVEEILSRDIEKIAKILSLVDGMFHLQVIIKESIPYIIDVTRRIPGDFYPFLIEEANDVEYSKAVVKAYLGDNIAEELVKKEDNFVIRYVVMPSKNGIYKGIKIDPAIENNIIYRFDLLDKGDIISDYINTQVAVILIKNYQETDSLDQVVVVEIDT